MPINPKYLADFFENTAYHIYNRTNNREKLFINEANYNFFLKQYKAYLAKYLDTFGWNLLTNHFHFVVRVQNESRIRKRLEAIGEIGRSLIETDFLNNRCTLSQLLVHAFKRFFQSYAQSFNKCHKRKGNLFHTAFKRILLETDEDIIRTMVYIHRNPLHHRLTVDFKTYPWSSWKNCLNPEKNGLLCPGALKLFKNRDEFILAHELLIDPDEENKFWIED